MASVPFQKRQMPFVYPAERFVFASDLIIEGDLKIARRKRLRESLR